MGLAVTRRMQVSLSSRTPVGGSLALSILPPLNLAPLWGVTILRGVTVLGGVTVLSRVTVLRGEPVLFLGRTRSLVGRLAVAPMTLLRGVTLTLLRGATLVVLRGVTLAVLRGVTLVVLRGVTAHVLFVALLMGVTVMNVGFLVRCHVLFVAVRLMRGIAAVWSGDTTVWRRDGLAGQVVSVA